jgi:fluoroacetyl-CoA thioesterase
MDAAGMVGREATVVIQVAEDQSAERFGNVGFPVLATPALVGLVELAAIEALRTSLDEGTGSVGGRIELSHQAPTAIGSSIEVQVRIVRVEGAMVEFKFRVLDATEPVAEGTHTRFVVDRARFLSGVQKRQNRRST